MTNFKTYLSATAIVSAGAIAMIAASTSAVMAEYPERPVTLIVPFGAGGNTDAVARAFQADFATALGSEVVVKNTAGAAGTIGTAEVAASEADGYSLGVIPIGPLTTQPHLRDLPYGKDSWEYICNVTKNPMVFLVSKDSPFNSIADVKTELEANPGKYLYGSAGPGTLPHLAMAASMGAMGVEAKHLPDSGTADGMRSMASGTIQFFADPPLVLSRYDVKALGSFTDERIEGLPDVPTMKEQGYPLSFSIWVGIVAPKGTPDAVVQKLSAACGEATKGPNFTKVTSSTSTNVEYMDSAEFGSFVESEFVKNGQVLKDAGLSK
ncbi:tripartite tricarboxylate transporter substrate binding protein [Pararhizobium sp. IMCC21322]|uniref:Bug family tripartite tricarboxylate transporter substrate binding protein n=1 Tax=Pararhizobium sp. IMCC21322 TaxID=3067903 RepID=UPI0027425684|nr:tripartite tricarboxylate transporter substrate binding protein [Pararhizobium sp. IMCC21322]